MSDTYPEGSRWEWDALGVVTIESVRRYRTPPGCYASFFEVVSVRSAAGVHPCYCPGVDLRRMEDSDG